MREIDGVIYYTLSNIGCLLNMCRLTVRNWVSFSDMLESEGKERLIPKPFKLNGQMLYRKEEVEQILKFAKTKKRGLMADFNRGRCGKRGQEIQKRMEQRILDLEKALQEQKEKQNNSKQYAGMTQEEYTKWFKYLKENAKNNDGGTKKK